MGREVKIRKINGDQKENLGNYVEIGGAKTEKQNLPNCREITFIKTIKSFA